MNAKVHSFIEQIQELFFTDAQTVLLAYPENFNGEDRFSLLRALNRIGYRKVYSINKILRIERP